MSDTDVTLDGAEQLGLPLPPEETLVYSSGEEPDQLELPLPPVFEPQIEVPDYEMVRYDDPVLRKPSEEFDFANPPIDPQTLACGLVKAMQKHRGLGISACQVGIPYRVFAITGSPLRVMFNPRIVDTSMERIDFEEGCLSVPGIFHTIKRPKSVRVRYWMPNGDAITEKFTGLTARVIQHEMDHLEGTLFIDYMPKLSLRRAIDKAAKRAGKYYIYGKLAKNAEGQD
jgi:peptide deformylase